MGRASNRRVYEEMYRYVWGEWTIRVWAKYGIPRETVTETVYRVLDSTRGGPGATSHQIAQAIADGDEEGINAVEVLNKTTLEGSLAYNDWP